MFLPRVLQLLAAQHREGAAQAQALLWGADSEQELTTVGHKAREAVQAFAAELVDRYKPAASDPDPAKATAEAVEEARSQLGPGVISAPPGSVRWGLCIATGWVDRHSPVSVRGHEGLNQH